jgi:hypothetical protein
MTRRIALFSALTLIPVFAQATVTYAAYYQLGASDPGALAGNPGNATTIDSSGNGFNLTEHVNHSGTAPSYSSNIPLVGTSPSMSFAGSSDYDGNVVTSVTNNFGIEAWVYILSVPSGSQAIAYNGTTGSSGFGLYTHNGFYAAFVGNVGFDNSSTPIVAGTWTNVAFVISGGHDTLYINGVGQSVANLIPFAAAGSMVIAANQAHGENFTGNIEDVAVFTFAPGAFSPSDLLYSQQTSTPEPASSGFLALGIGVLIGIRCIYRKGSKAGQPELAEPDLSFPLCDRPRLFESARAIVKHVSGRRT